MCNLLQFGQSECGHYILHINLHPTSRFYPLVIKCTRWGSWNMHSKIQSHVNNENYFVLTHWGRMTHMCVCKLTIIGSDNGLSPGLRQAIIWTNAGLLLIRHLETIFSEILIGIQTFSFKKIYLKMSSAKWRPFCPGLNMLNCANDNLYLSWRPI